MRIACTLAEMERRGGVSPRVSPFAQVRGQPVFGHPLSPEEAPGGNMYQFTVRARSDLFTFRCRSACVQTGCEG